MSPGLSVTQICILCYELLQPRIGNIKHDENAPFFNEIPYTNHTNPPKKPIVELLHGSELVGQLVCWGSGSIFCEL